MTDSTHIVVSRKWLAGLLREMASLLSEYPGNDELYAYRIADDIEAGNLTMNWCLQNAPAIDREYMLALARCRPDYSGIE